MKKAVTALETANLIAIEDDNLAEIKQLTPLISKIIKEIRVEEQQLGILLTVTEAQKRFEDVKDALIELIWKHAPEAAPVIAREAPSAMRAGVD